MIVNKELEEVWKEAKRGDLTGDWRKLHSEELHDLYPPSISLLIKSGRIRLARRVVRVGQS
jgi:hypothetical protein